MPDLTARTTRLYDQGRDSSHHELPQVVDNSNNQSEVIHPNNIVEDLSNHPSKLLRKIPDHKVRLSEAHGQLYADIFRKLQVKPSHYQQFYEGVVRSIRQKHWAEIKRNTDASIRMVTSLLLRGFGYLVWPVATSWLIDDSVLEANESKLVYVRNAEHAENEAFYPIFEQLWRRMRNVLFEKKPDSSKHGPRKGMMNRNNGAQMRTDSEDSWLGDVDTDYNMTTAPSSPSSFAHPPPQQQYERNINSPTQTMASFQQTHSSATDREMNADEIINAIHSITIQLSSIRAQSNPELFDALWSEHISRVEEISAAEAVQNPHTTPENLTTAPVNAFDQTSADNSTSDCHITTPNTPNPHNLQFSQLYAPTPPSLAEAVCLPPRLPETLSVYITTSHVTTPDPTQLHYRPSQHHSNVYHWHSAPVTSDNAARDAFFNGIQLRAIAVPIMLDLNQKIVTDDYVFGWSLSYSWNDGGIFIYRDRKQQGWAIFQADLRDAAMRGVRIWRVKVCVVYITLNERHQQ